MAKAKNNEYITKKLNLRYSIHFCIMISFVFFFLASIIIVNISAYMDGVMTYLFSLILCFPFGAIFGLVLNRLIIVRYSKFHESMVQYTVFTKLGKVIGRRFSIFLVLFIIIYIAVMPFIPGIPEKPTDFEHPVISNIYNLRKAESEYFKTHGKYAQPNDLAALGILESTDNEFRIPGHSIKFQVNGDFWQVKVVPKKRKMNNPSFYLDSNIPYVIMSDQ